MTAPGPRRVYRRRAGALSVDQRVAKVHAQWEADLLTPADYLAATRSLDSFAYRVARQAVREARQEARS